MTAAVALVGVDLGGTAIKAGRVVGGGVVRRTEAPTPQEFEACMDAVAGVVRDLSRDGALGPVGMGLPGVIGPRRDVVLDAPNLPFLERQPAAAALSERLRVPVVLENDANAAAVGEARHGAGRHHPDFLLATLGTGIGGGLVLGGRLYRGPGGMAAEFGHIGVGHQRVCGCGARGCLEAAVSARALVLWARDEGIEASGLPELADLARRGHRPTQQLFRRAGAMLGEAFATVALLLDLRVFIVGGGGGPALELLRPAALQVLASRAFGRSADEFQILAAALGNDAGILGAAALAGEAAGG